MNAIKRGQMLLFSLILIALLFSMFPVKALADSGVASDITSSNIIQVDKEYGSGTLKTITITGAEVVSITPQETGKENTFVYNVVLLPGTKIGTLVDAEFNFEGQTGNSPKFPNISPTTQAVGKYGDAKETNSAINKAGGKLQAQISSLSAKNDTTGYIFSNKKAVQSDTVSATYTLSYTVAPWDDGPEVPVNNLKQATPPDKLEYYTGEYFDPAGLTLSADGVQEPFHECTWSPEGSLTTDDTQITISYGGQSFTIPITVKPRNILLDAEILDDKGVFLYKPFLLDETQYYVNGPLYDRTQEIGKGKILVYTGNSELQVELTLPSADTEVYLNEESSPLVKKTDDPTKCILTLKNDHSSNKVTLKCEGEEDKEYTFICDGQMKGTPDRVVDFLTINSQYTNAGNYVNPCVGINAWATLMGGSGTDTGQLNQPPYSLGNFGGYITYWYEKAITDSPNNPFGVDFIVYGNPVHAHSGYCEPGQVYVSENGTDWYALAGSLHYEDCVTWDYSIRYQKAEDEKTNVSVNGGAWKKSNILFPWQERYPLFDWENKCVNNTITLSGVHIGAAAEADGYGNTIPTFPHFGYADHGQQYNKKKSNEADNPYLPFVNGEVAGADGFDLAWAVDESGNPVKLENGIHYIRIQTATNMVNGAIGEKSTEINMMLLAAPGEENVGKTAAPDSVTIAGQKVEFDLEESANNVYTATAAVPKGAFLLKIDAGDNANGEGGKNVMIGNLRDTVRAFAQMPTHNMIRVIVQEGEKEPWIGVITLNESEDTGAAATTVTFDPAGGSLGGNTTRIYMPGMEEAECTFPTPTWEKRTFLGWFDDADKQYTKYEAGMPAELKLTARWEYQRAEDEAPTVNVTFRLIGSTRSSGDVDLSKGEAGYYGAAYQNWIPTRSYTLPAGSTVLDLMKRAAADAGIRFDNPSGNYVTGVYAPSVLGGYLLKEMTNGPRSGWMYTVNGVHALSGVEYENLEDGMEVIFHYVNDYAYEVSDWDKIGGEGFPSMGDGTFYDRWLDAADIQPNSSMIPSEDKEQEAPALTPEAAPDKNGEAKAEVSAKDVTGAVEAARDTEAGGVTVKPEVKGDADKVTVELPKSSAGDIADAGLDLTVETDKGNVILPSSALKDLGGQSGSSVSVSVEAVKNNSGKTTGETAIEVKVGNTTVDRLTGGIKASLPVKEGDVLVVVEPDGTETVVKKSLAEDGQIEALLDGSCTVKVIDNSTDFSDVAAGAWYAGAVDFASSHELFNGTGGNAFSPNAPMTRGMLATVLWRLEDEAKAGTAASFTDVGDTWYTDGIAWANEQGIVTGYGGGKFGPGDNITREQLAVMLYRYAKGLHLDTATTGDLSKYTDSGKVSGYAEEAMVWAVGSGVLQGTGGGLLDPAGNASRAQVATMLQRMVRLIVM